MFASRNAALVNRTRRLGSNTPLPVLEFVVESGGSVSCDTQLNCLLPQVSLCLWAPRTLHNSNWTFVFILLRLSVWLFCYLPVRTWAPNSKTQISLYRTDIREDAYTHTAIWRFGASTFQVFRRRSTEFLKLVSASGTISWHTSASRFWRSWFRSRFGFRCRFRCSHAGN